METQHLVCVGCGNTFDFTVGEQQFYEEKGYTPPKRCRECRAKKKAEREMTAREQESGHYHGAAHFG